LIIVSGMQLDEERVLTTEDDHFVGSKLRSMERQPFKDFFRDNQNIGIKPLDFSMLIKKNPFENDIKMNRTNGNQLGSLYLPTAPNYINTQSFQDGKENDKYISTTIYTTNTQGDIQPKKPKKNFKTYPKGNLKKGEKCHYSLAQSQLTPISYSSLITRKYTSTQCSEIEQEMSIDSFQKNILNKRSKYGKSSSEMHMSKTESPTTLHLKKLHTTDNNDIFSSNGRHRNKSHFRNNSMNSSKFNVLDLIDIDETN